MSGTSLFKSFGFSISSISENRRIPNNSNTPWVLIPGGQKVRTFLQRKTTVFESKTVVFMAMIHETDTILQQGVAVLIQYEYFTVRCHIHRHILP